MTYQIAVIVGSLRKESFNRKIALNLMELAQPEAYIGNAGNMFDPNGKVSDEKTRGFLRKFIEVYASWVTRHAN